MKSLNPIERTAFEQMNEWRKQHGLVPLREPEDMAESERFLYADEDELDRYNMDEHDDERLDDPRYDQCENGRFKG